MIIKIFYNDVVLGEAPRVKPNCPSIQVPIEDAQRIAKEKIDAGEWSAYLIPELHHAQVVFDEDKD